MTTEAEMNLEHGDPFELEHSHWLRSRLPNYEKVWAAFIGYDGLSRPLPIPGLHPDVEVLRFYVSDRPSRLFSAQQETVQRSPGWDWIFTFVVAEMGASGCSVLLS